MKPNPTKPVILCTARAAILDLPEDTRQAVLEAALADVSDTAHFQLRMAHIAQVYDDAGREHGITPGFNAATARRALAVALAAAALNPNVEIPDLWRKELLGDGVDADWRVADAIANVWTKLDEPHREIYRRQFERMAVSANGIDSVAAAMIVDEIACEAAYERDMTALNETFANGTWTINCEVCDREVHNAEAMFDASGNGYCREHAPDGATQGAH